jgi:two-component system sensor histidine kinase CiaH
LLVQKLARRGGCEVFQSAAIKLTAWYIAIIMALSIGCSMALYNVSSNDLENNTRRRLPVSVNELLSPRDVRNLADLRGRQLETDLGHLKSNLISFNILVFLLGGAASYALARRTLEPIEQSLDAQKRFTSDASHELRTPLTAMQAEIEVALRDPKLTKVQALELLESNLEEVEKLRRLSDGLLNLAQHKKKADLKAIDIKPAVIEAIGRMEKQTSVRKITINNTVKDLKVKADHYSLTELLVVLIDNAVKYSPDKSTIKLTSEASGKSARISVRDEGIGIKASDLPHIFERFYRSDTSRSKTHAEGYGLGLAIAKKIADSLDGSIEVKSAPDKGSTFTITLPAA